MPLPRLFGGIRKMVARAADCCTQQFSRGFGIIRITIGHLKRENKWESSGSLDSNEQDIEGLRAAQRNELVVPIQDRNIVFSSKRRLSWMSSTEKWGVHLGPFLGKIAKQIPGVNYMHRIMNSDLVTKRLSLTQTNYFNPRISNLAHTTRGQKR